MLEPKQVWLNGANAGVLELTPFALDGGSILERLVEIVSNREHRANRSRANLHADEALLFLLGGHSERSRATTTRRAPTSPITSRPTPASVSRCFRRAPIFLWSTSLSETSVSMMSRPRFEH